MRANRVATLAVLLALSSSPARAEVTTGVDAPPVSTLGDTVWNDAEARLRTALERADITPTDIVRTPGANVLVFVVTTNVGTTFYATVAGKKAYVSTDKHRDATVAAILRAERLHERTDLRASDIILVVHAFGTVPAAIKQAIDRTPIGRPLVGLRSEGLQQGKGGARLEVRVRRPGSHEDWKTEHLYKGVLTISKSYALTWKVTSIDEPIAIP